MTPDQLGAWANLLSQFGLPAVALVGLLLALHRGWLVPGRAYDAHVKLLTDEITYLQGECKEWKTSSLLAHRIMEAALESANTTVAALQSDPAIRPRPRGGGPRV